MMKYLLFISIPLLLGGCLAAEPPADPFAGMRTGDGSILWEDEYRFTPPPPPWQLLTLDEDDYSVAFFRGCRKEGPGNYPCASTLAYAEEPFGYSRDLEERQEEFFRRFLWAARVDFEKPSLKQTQALGGEALQADTVGHERVLEHKVLVRVIFAHRGERVVAFYFTQWRPADEEFDRRQLKALENFVDGFTFTGPSFYEKLVSRQD